MVISAMLARQITLLDPLPSTLSPLLRYSCKLFVALPNAKSFAINQFRTLYAKYRGWGYLSDSSALSASQRYHLPVFFPPLCFHNLTNPFSRKPFVCRSIQNPGGVGYVCTYWNVAVESAIFVLAITDHNSRAFSSLQPLCFSWALFCELPSFVFNRLQPLLQKRGGGWGCSVFWG
jgi:hypothetical protein